MNGKNILLMGLFILIGAGLLIYSYENIKTYNEKNASYIEVNGKVSSYDYKIDDDGSQLSAPIIEYVVDDNAYRLKGDYSLRPIRLGSDVVIKYNKNNPSDAIIKGDKSYILPIIVGIVFVVLGVYGIIYEVRNRY